MSRGRKVDMRGLTLQAYALELGESSAIAGEKYKFSNTTYKATVTVANGATTGKETAIGMPANFIPQCVAVEVTVASTNPSNLNDIGEDNDTDAYVDGIAVSVASTGFKGVFGCNGVRGMGPGSTSSITGALTTADEVEVVVSADPGATGVTMELSFFGVLVEAI